MEDLVMVIEDDLDCLEAVSAGLEYGGYAVVTATNGLEALHHLEATPPNPRPRLILLDMMMPVMGGQEFVKELRKRPGLAVIPVVLFSAERGLAHQAAELGVAGYVKKPVDLDDMLATLRRLLDRAPEEAKT